MTHDTDALTPIEELDGMYAKRDDLFTLPKGFSTYTGTKARVAVILAKEKTGLTTIHTGQYPQGPLVAAVAKLTKIPCRIHTTQKTARGMFGVRPHGSTVIIHGTEEDMKNTAQADAHLTGFFYMPVNMECSLGQESIIKQCANIPDDVTRVVVPAKEGATALAILQALEQHGKKTKMLVHGRDTIAIAGYFRTFGPDDWHSRVSIKDKPDHPRGVMDLVWVGNVL